MKIISGGKKDYYDYLAGIYGIDEDIVYDRRSSVVFLDRNNRDYSLLKLFGKTILYDDKEKAPKRFWTGKIHVEKLVGESLSFCLEIGYYQYLFDVERYIENGKICVIPKLRNIIDRGIHIGDSPICLYYDYMVFCVTH